MHYNRFLAHGNPLGGNTFEGAPLRYLQDVVFPYRGDDCLVWPFAKNTQGYGRITLDGKNRVVSRVVCENYSGPPPTPEHEAAHSCGKGHKGCCSPTHLRWATRVENQADRLVHGTHTRGEKNYRSKLTETDVHAIRGLKGKMSQREIAALFRVERTVIRGIHNRTRWGWLE